MGLNFYDYLDFQKNQGGNRIMKHTVNEKKIRQVLESKNHYVLRVLKHPFGIPGVRPVFLKPKLHKESKNGFKTINSRCYPVMIFSKTCFWRKKNHQKKLNVLLIFKLSRQYICNFYFDTPSFVLYLLFEINWPLPCSSERLVLLKV